MKIKLFISFAAFVAASALMCSCSNEESADSNNSNSNSNGQLTAFTGGIVTEAPMERMQLSTPEISTEVPGFLTRTSMNRKAIGGQGVFYWEPGDKIYVEDDNKTLFKSQNTINAAVDCATFLVDGSYTKEEYNVYYCGTNSGAGEKKVVIANNQTQVAFNNTKHFGAAGDCGVAKAEKKTTVAGKNGYSFKLVHKASYLCFLPYIPSQQDRTNYKIKRIKITSYTDNISGTYDLDQNGLSGSGDSKTITLNVGTGEKGLALADQSKATTNINNSLYVVIAPGERKLSVKYTVYSVKDNKELTLTKNYPSHNFAVNRICDIPVSLGSADLNGGHANAGGSDILPDLYGGHNYYMWDAFENYWSGHEWDSTDPWQPKENSKRANRYPKSASDDRWYHEGSGALEAFVNPLFKELPNANEIAWYVLKGDAHWDKDKSWPALGNNYSGGIWLKKLSVIAQENGKKLYKLKLAAPDGTNLLASPSEGTGTLQQGKPAESEIDKYFFLPALGFWYEGALSGLGSIGFYWSSSADPSDNNKAYSLFFNIKQNELKFGNNSYRSYGFVAQPFE